MPSDSQGQKTPGSGGGATADRPTRRDLLRRAGLSGALLFCGLDKLWGSPSQETIVGGTPAGKLLGVVPFTGEPTVPLGEPLGSELDGRLYTNLSSVSNEAPVTPTGQFYIRTRASNLLDAAKPWSIRVQGQLLKPFDLSMDELRRTTRPLGRHLLECAGNVRSAHFGMMSVADWAGVPLSEILKRATPRPRATRVLISGFDTYSAKSASSIPGASWIFKFEDLEAAGAFLATEMNGAPLTKDHGAPVRLMVPGWYGCTCIKWVNEILFSGEDVEATSQMQEYASRTMQAGMPKLAREYAPALIEHAAVPVRVEKWQAGDAISYRVLGILWGGSVPVKRLQIRFNPEEDYVDVSDFTQKSNDPWSFWTHLWQPKRPGTYIIRLRVAEPSVVASRLDSGFYARSVEISET